MKTIIITGSTRGIGFALAKALLSKDCRVIISGRRQKNVNNSLKKLAQEFSPDSMAGFACDVVEFKQVLALWDKAVSRFGSIDIWINNSGISNQINQPWNLPADEIKNVVATNILGEMYGTKVAINGFKKQGYGALYYMEGMGAKSSRKIKGLSIYGATKASLGYFNDAIFSEIDHQKIIIGAIQPGMMLTDMVMSQYEGKPDEWQKVAGILTALSEDVDTVAEWLAKKILANKKNGKRLNYGGMLRMIIRLIGRKINQN